MEHQPWVKPGDTKHFQFPDASESASIGPWWYANDDTASACLLLAAFHAVFIWFCCTVTHMLRLLWLLLYQLMSISCPKMHQLCFFRLIDLIHLPDWVKKSAHSFAASTTFHGVLEIVYIRDTMALTAHIAPVVVNMIISILKVCWYVNYIHFWIYC